MTGPCTHCGGTGLATSDGDRLPGIMSLSTIIVTTVDRDDLFADWWAMYPRKQAKAAAVKSWARMNTIDRAHALDALPTHIAMWRHEGRGTSLIPMPATWLNQQRWEDDLTGYTDPQPVQPRKPMPGRSGISAALANRTHLTLATPNQTGTQP